MKLDMEWFLVKFLRPRETSQIVYLMDLWGFRGLFKNSRIQEFFGILKSVPPPPVAGRFGLGHVYWVSPSRLTLQPNLFKIWAAAFGVMLKVRSESSQLTPLSQSVSMWSLYSSMIATGDRSRSLFRTRMK